MRGLGLVLVLELVEVREGVGVAVDAEAAPPAEALVLPEPVRGGEAERAAPVGERPARVVAALRVAAGDHRPTQADLGLVFQHDVDDAAHAVGLVAGRGVGDDLDALDGAGGELAEVGGDVLAADGGRTSVDEDGDVPAPAQADVAVDVDVDGGDRLQDVRGRPPHGDGGVGGAVDHPVDLDLERGPFGGHLHLVHDLLVRGEADRAHVDPPPVAPERDVGDGLRAVAYEAEADVVCPAGQALDGEAAVVPRDGPGDERGVAAVPDPHRRRREGLGRLRIHDGAGDPASRGAIGSGRVLSLGHRRGAEEEEGDRQQGE